MSPVANKRTGATEDELQKASNGPTKPAKTMTDGMSIFLLETEKPLFISDWAVEAAIKNVKGKNKSVATSKDGSRL